ncbi:AbrB/MazE/SpoVT family DNA-binding domain-containing protein [Methylomonas sp. MO1]|uniref:AbrB/MazE/SpoVT family DNA-binding domain-containing protein n=1 Tax=Methylomonas defluvii TaxID=3045149 RepID=A0ABU4ULT3_9GAMM|nr:MULTISPECIES: AbrB/MazE/SpoVT family DNA-binding domain-containing protein [unclassified Methylomonas]MDT4289532.1 AbrB/MazE/SpoVT family DNA-binding domain-containing protein [Methylomonas sp. MO1]MDX8130380.1 AbrB/MazE/SpoVT family DNA-binding domain-containing protein [Methylomonas sp. OY6]QBC25432.1 AbrB/MazE/SpoVT family DNA-binding domain-containing protein [Methylomonas sp. LW13]
MQTEIKKWGNSAVVRLPARMLAQLKLEVGSSVELTVDETGFRIERTTAKPKLKLDDLLAEITPDNRHEPIEWGTSVGREVAM